MGLTRLFKSRSKDERFAPETLSARAAMRLMEQGKLFSKTVRRRDAEGKLHTKHLRLTADDMSILEEQMKRDPLHMDWKGAQNWQDARDNQEYRIATAIIKHRHTNQPGGLALS